MSSKDNAAISQLLGLLESRYAMRVLWALKDGHAQTFRLLPPSGQTISGPPNPGRQANGLGRGPRWTVKSALFHVGVVVPAK